MSHVGVMDYGKMIAASVLTLAVAGGCQTVYYNTMEKVGVHKREILVDRIEEARDSQQEAKEQFSSALEHFSSVVGFEGGSLEEKYKSLKKELDRSEEKAEAVGDRIDAVEDVADALFDEWKDELKQYSSASLRKTSEKKLDETKKRYARLMDAMKKAESRIEPVLRPLRDQVLFLKHNLNARAISSLQTELVSIEGNVESLIREMERAIEEATSFISTLQEEG